MKLQERGVPKIIDILLKENFKINYTELLSSPGKIIVRNRSDYFFGVEYK